MSQIRYDLDNGNRLCNRCGKEKVLDDFPRDKKCSLGRARTCKACVYEKRAINNMGKENEIKDYKHEWYLANRDRLLEERKQYYDANKEKILDYQNKYYSDNDGKVKARVRRWQKKNPEKRSEYAHRRRTWKMHNGRNDLTADEIKLLKESFPFCVYCGTDEDLTIDHIVPLSKGGENTFGNCTIACRSCNASKSDNL